MNKIISPLGFNNFMDLKRDILLYDEIHFDPRYSYSQIQTYEWFNFNKEYTNGKRKISKDRYDADIEFLKNEGILFEISFLEDITKLLDDIFKNHNDKFISTFKDYEFVGELSLYIAEQISGKVTKPKKELHYSLVNTFQDYVVRLYALMKNTVQSENQFYALNSNDPANFNNSIGNSKEDKSAEVLNIIIENIPVPDDSIPYDEILDWKNLNENKLRYKGFVRWAKKMMNQNLSKTEFKDELEYLTLEFENRMKLEKMKYKITNLEIIFSAPLKILEDFIKVNWSNIPKTLASIRKNKINLLISETKAPGKEISYLSSTKEKFEKNDI